MIRDLSPRASDNCSSGSVKRGGEVTLGLFISPSTGATMFNLLYSSIDGEGFNSMVCLAKSNTQGIRSS